MTFHLDVVDAGGRATRVTFSTLYSVPPPPTTPRGGGGGGRGANGRGVTDPSAVVNGGDHAGGRAPTFGGKHFNASGTAAATAVVTWKGGVGGGGSSGRGGDGGGNTDCGTGTETAALSRRGGALRIPVSFDASRSRGWTVIAVDMVNLMREGRGCGDGVEEEGVRAGAGAGGGQGVRGFEIGEAGLQHGREGRVRVGLRLLAADHAEGYGVPLARGWGLGSRVQVDVAS